MRAEETLSDEYQETARLLGENWSGTFGALAEKLGRTPRSALLAVRMVRSYSRRHPEWNTSKVYRQS